MNKNTIMPEETEVLTKEEQKAKDYLDKNYGKVLPEDTAKSDKDAEFEAMAKAEVKAPAKKSTVEALYNALNKKGDYTKSLEEFKTQFGSEEGQIRLYNALFDKGDYTKSEKEFKSQFFSSEVKKKPISPDSPQPVDPLNPKAPTSPSDLESASTLEDGVYSLEPKSDTKEFDYKNFDALQRDVAKADSYGKDQAAYLLGKSIHGGELPEYETDYENKKESFELLDKQRKEFETDQYINKLPEEDQSTYRALKNTLDLTEDDSFWSYLGRTATGALRKASPGIPKTKIEMKEDLRAATVKALDKFTTKVTNTSQETLKNDVSDIDSQVTKLNEDTSLSEVEKQEVYSGLLNTRKDLVKQYVDLGNTANTIYSLNHDIQMGNIESFNKSFANVIVSAPRQMGSLMKGISAFSTDPRTGVLAEEAYKFLSDFSDTMTFESDEDNPMANELGSLLGIMVANGAFASVAGTPGGVLYLLGMMHDDLYRDMRMQNEEFDLGISDEKLLWVSNVGAVASTGIFMAAGANKILNKGLKKELGKDFVKYISKNKSALNESTIEGGFKNVQDGFVSWVKASNKHGIELSGAMTGTQIVSMGLKQGINYTQGLDKQLIVSQNGVLPDLMHTARNGYLIGFGLNLLHKPKWEGYKYDQIETALKNSDYVVKTKETLRSWEKSKEISEKDYKDLIQNLNDDTYAINSVADKTNIPIEKRQAAAKILSQIQKLEREVDGKGGQQYYEDLIKDLKLEVDILLTPEGKTLKSEQKKEEGSSKTSTEAPKAPKKEEVKVEPKEETVIPDLFKDNEVAELVKNTEGGFLNEKERIALEKEIESNYAKPDEVVKLGPDNKDIRTKLFNYDNPISEKTINGVNIRIAEGLTRDKRKSYLLYSDGKIVGEFYSVKAVEKLVDLIEKKLIKTDIKSIADAKDGVKTVPISEVNADPKRFQFKADVNEKGVSDKLEGRKYNPELAGVVSVWVDPKDGKTYVINGHHRYELALKNKVENIDVRYIDAENASDARRIGAMQNIAEGQGTVIDAAKMFREDKTDDLVGDLKDYGLALSDSKTENGLALAKLSDPLFKLVAEGKLPENIGIIIGRNIEKPEVQEQFYNKIKNRNLSQKAIDIMAQDINASKVTKEVVTDLFGTTEKETAEYESRANLISSVRDVLNQTKNVLGKTAKNKEFLKKFGNEIDAEKSKGAGEQAAVGLVIFDKLRNTSPEIKSIIDKAVIEAEKSKDKKKVYGKAAREIVKTIPKVLENKGSKNVGTSTGAKKSKPKPDKEKAVAKKSKPKPAEKKPEEEKITVYRGKGRNYAEGENEGFHWVTDSKELAKDYASTKGGILDVEVSEVSPPKNPLTFPWKNQNTAIIGENMANVFRQILIRNAQAKKITMEDGRALTEKIKEFEKSAGKKPQPWHTMLNKPETARLAADILSQLGYDAVSMPTQVGKYGVPGTTKENTYGFIKKAKKKAAIPKIPEGLLKERKPKKKKPTKKEVKESKDKVIELLDKAIEATDTQGKLFDATLAIPLTVANQSLRLAKEVYIKGGDFIKAVERGIQFLKDEGFIVDAKTYEKYLTDIMNGETPSLEGKFDRATIDAKTSKSISEIGRNLKTPKLSGTKVQNFFGQFAYIKRRGITDAVRFDNKSINYTWVKDILQLDYESLTDKEALMFLNMIETYKKDGSLPNFIRFKEIMAREAIEDFNQKHEEIPSLKNVPFLERLSVFSLGNIHQMISSTFKGWNTDVKNELKTISAITEIENGLGRNKMNKERSIPKRKEIVERANKTIERIIKDYKREGSTPKIDKKEITKTQVTEILLTEADLIGRILAPTEQIESQAHWFSLMKHNIGRSLANYKRLIDLNNNVPEKVEVYKARQKAHLEFMDFYRDFMSEYEITKTSKNGKVTTKRSPEGTAILNKPLTENHPFMQAMRQQYPDAKSIHVEQTKIHQIQQELLENYTVMRGDNIKYNPEYTSTNIKTVPVLDSKTSDAVKESTDFVKDLLADYKRSKKMPLRHDAASLKIREKGGLGVDDYYDGGGAYFTNQNRAYDTASKESLITPSLIHFETAMGNENFRKLVGSPKRVQLLRNEIAKAINYNSKRDEFGIEFDTDTKSGRNAERAAASALNQMYRVLWGPGQTLKQSTQAVYPVVTTFSTGSLPKVLLDMAGGGQKASAMMDLFANNSSTSSRNALDLFDTNIGKTALFWKGASNMAGKLFIADSDYRAAAVTWFASYRHWRLKSQKTKAKDFNWESEALNPNKEALSHANTEVALSQGASIRELQADFIKDPNLAKQIARAYLMPFSTFMTQMKMSVGTDLTQLRTDPYAKKRVAGYAAVMASYHTTSAVIKMTYGTFLYNKLTGFIQDDEMKRLFRQIRQQDQASILDRVKAGMLKDGGLFFVPASPYLENITLNAINYTHYAIDNYLTKGGVFKNQDEWKASGGSHFPIFDVKHDYLFPEAEFISGAAKAGYVLHKGKMTYTDFSGSPHDKTLNEDELKLVKIEMYSQALALLMFDQNARGEVKKFAATLKKMNSPNWFKNKAVRGELTDLDMEVVDNMLRNNIQRLDKKTISMIKSLLINENMFIDKSIHVDRLRVKVKRELMSLIGRKGLTYDQIMKMGELRERLYEIDIELDEELEEGTWEKILK